MNLTRCVFCNEVAVVLATRIVGGIPYETAMCRRHATDELGDNVMEILDPALTKRLSAKSKDRLIAVGRRMQLHQRDAEPELALQALLELAEDDEPCLRWYAAHTLGSYGPIASQAIPVLREMLEDVHEPTRVSAAWALWRIDRETKLTVPILAAILGGRDRYAESLGRDTLLEIACDAPNGILALTDLLKHVNPIIRREGARLLGKLAPSGDAAIPHLLIALQDDDSDVRVAAQDALKRFGR